MNPLLKINEFGQSIWLDYLRRNIIESGELRRLIEEDGLRGITSNPSIFEKAIAGSHDYDQSIRSLALAGKSAQEIYDALTIEDIRNSADLLRPVFERMDGTDGFVSLEVSPLLALDTEKTIKEARRLWKEVDRPNVMIKVPATEAGIPAIGILLEEGININITLLFGIPRYCEVAQAYVSALEARARRGEPLRDVASVASFFLSRIDVLVDSQLEKIIKDGGVKAKTAESLVGNTAILSAKIAYKLYNKIFGSTRFRKLAAKGARSQRVLWASTSTKNPSYSDVKYVEALIGPETINTMPPETINAYRDHGDPAPRLTDGMDKAQRELNKLARLGIDIDQVTQKLENDGIRKFNEPFEKLIGTIKKGIERALTGPVDTQKFHLGRQAVGQVNIDELMVSAEPLQKSISSRISTMEKDRFAERLWKKDPSLWKQDPQIQKEISNGLGWLHVAEKMEEFIPDLLDFAREIRSAGFKHVVHMGMGGSSLAPLVFQRTFRTGHEGLPLTVLDTNDPVTIKRIEENIPLAETLFIVASKSGTTAEPLAFDDYFYNRVAATKKNAGDNFIAITDPGSPLVQSARDRKFRRCFPNFRDIGGRYSALSCFGLVPAALLGVDLKELISRALRMAHACGSSVPVERNAALLLGTARENLL